MARTPMSFRTRLTSFFVLIVVVPMIAIGALVFRLIGDSAQGKADARVSGLATAAVSLYQHQAASARTDAQSVARQVARIPLATLRSTLSATAAQAGLARVVVTADGRKLADVGDRNAIAPGAAHFRSAAGFALAVTVSTLTAAEFAHDLTNIAGVGVIVRQGVCTLTASLALPDGTRLPAHGTLSVRGVQYRVLTELLPGFGNQTVGITVLSDVSASTGSVGTSRLIAGIFIGGFLLLAFAFSILSSRALQGQVRRFLDAARRLGGGDFSSPVPIEGHDEFAALGHEFNRMSAQLARRLDELSTERARLRDSVTRIGHTFGSNLDQHALLELALRTAVDAVGAGGGRVTLRASAEVPLHEVVREGSLEGLEAQVLRAERTALRLGDAGEAPGEDGALSIPLGKFEPGDRVRGLVTLARPSERFGPGDCELLRFLASQATLALENVELHFQVRRQAVTDELTSLANHGSFQDLLSAEIEQVRRYHHTLGLIMVDIDNFKQVNDTYGHQQGDLVLRHVARVLRDNSREADTPARYGGEEMALILPHTDLEGAHAIAERVRTAICELEVSRLDGHGMVRVTASLGVAATTGAGKRELIADADDALYRAKRAGKNRTVQTVGPRGDQVPAESAGAAPTGTATVVPGE